VQPFHPVGVCLLGRDLCPLVGLFVAGDSVVSRALSDFGNSLCAILIFLFIHYLHATNQIMARLYPVRFLSAVRAVAAHCKLPFPLRPGQSRGDAIRTKEITKERDACVKDKGKDKRKACPPP